MTVPREGTGRTVLITGASAGIGAALANVFARHGFDLVLTARREERLNALAQALIGAHGVKVWVMGADLARADACADLVAAIEGEGVAIDGLVNNAGYSIPEAYLATSWPSQADFLRVLVAAPCELAHRLLPGMAQRGYGRVLNVASVAGLLPGAANHTLYSGAKAMMIKWSQALHSEVKKAGVHVSALCPGFTLTEFHDVNGTRDTMRIPRFLWLSAERVAQDGYDAVMRNAPVTIPGLPYKVICAAARLVPESVAHRIAERRTRALERRPPR